MRGGAAILGFAMLSLAACEKNFDQKYQDNLDQLNEEAKAIESGVDKQLAEGRKADTIIGSAQEAEDAGETAGEAAQ